VIGRSGPETRARCPLQQLLAVAILVYLECIWKYCVIYILKFQGSVDWTWLGDVERSCALLVGRILNSVAQGVSFDTEEESESTTLLSSPLLANGLGKDFHSIGKFLKLTFYWYLIRLVLVQASSMTCFKVKKRDIQLDFIIWSVLQ